jgi:hypothetical protein
VTSGGEPGESPELGGAQQEHKHKEVQSTGDLSHPAQEGGGEFEF